MHFKELFKKKSTGLLVSFLRQSNFKMFATEIFPVSFHRYLNLIKGANY
jgi:hypothetical protein